MKKVIYFFTLTLLIVSCNVTKEIYDDVYDQTELNPTTPVDKDNGYADYIKKEERKYKVEPEKDHYSYINVDNGNSFNNGFVNFDNNGADYYCYHHNRFHSHYFDTHYCSDWPNYNFSYYNNPYTPFGYAYACNSYPNYYGGFGYNSNYASYYWGNYGNADPYSPWSVIYPNSQDSEDAYASSNHYYGHRSGTSFGTNSNNTTVYTHTVKKTDLDKNIPSTGLPFGKTDQNHSLTSKNIVSTTPYSNIETPIKIESQNSPQQNQFATNTINQSNPRPVQGQTATSNTPQKTIHINKPATNPFSKPAKTNNSTVSKTGTTATNNNTSGGNANSNSNYQNKYNGYTNNNTTSTYKTNNTAPSTSTSRRTTTTTKTNTNKTTPSTNRGNSSGTTSGHRGGGSGSSGSSSGSGSSRR